MWTSYTQPKKNSWEHTLNTFPSCKWTLISIKLLLITLHPLPHHLVCTCTPPDTAHWDKKLGRCGSSGHCRRSRTVRREHSDLHWGCTLHHRSSPPHTEPRSPPEGSDYGKRSDSRVHKLHSGCGLDISPLYTSDIKDNKCKCSLSFNRDKYNYIFKIQAVNPKQYKGSGKEETYKDV